eukprot:1675871-Pyramimonas_sp.AAC.1
MQLALEGRAARASEGISECGPSRPAFPPSHLLVSCHRSSSPQHTERNLTREWVPCERTAR